MIMDFIGENIMVTLVLFVVSVVIIMFLFWLYCMIDNWVFMIGEKKYNKLKVKELKKTYEEIVDKMDYKTVANLLDNVTIWGSVFPEEVMSEEKNKEGQVEKAVRWYLNIDGLVELETRPFIEIKFIDDLVVSKEQRGLLK